MEAVRDGPRHKMRTVRTRRDTGDRGGMCPGRYGEREERADDRETGEGFDSSHCVRYSHWLLKVGMVELEGNQLARPTGTLSRMKAEDRF